MSARSAIYDGSVFHRRLEPVENSISFPLRLPLLDLAELPEALDPHPLWSARRPAPVRFRASDFLVLPNEPDAAGPAELAERAWHLAEPATGAEQRGPVRVLASPRVFGVGFNPVSFIFLHEPGGAARAAIAEVTNTPWGERQTYVMRPGGRDGTLRASVAKRMHVSPFNGMEQSYELAISQPGDRIATSVVNREGDRTVFEAGMTMRRLPIDRRELGRTFAREPFGPIGTLARIYGHALRLRLKGAPYHPHPAKGARPDPRIG